MNHLVFLNSQTGELEKILSGVKTMLLKEFDPAPWGEHPVKPGDTLYFLREDECTIRVKATVIQVLPVASCSAEDLSQILKERQPKLQLTEEQYNGWSAKEQALLVELDCAQKISVIQVDLSKITDRSDWIPFEAVDYST